MKIIILGILALVIIPLGSILNGFIICDMWKWFIVPIFPNMPILTIGQAIGLGLITAWMCKYQKITDTEEEKNRNINYIQAIFPFSVWFCAWILHLIIN